VYGPKEDNPHVYNLSRTLFDLGNKDIIITGDFNLVMNPDIDFFNYLHFDNPKARDKVLEIMYQFNLRDIHIYREFHPDKRRVTWRKPTPLKQAKLVQCCFKHGTRKQHPSKL
jgi:hypothetical protein